MLYRQRVGLYNFRPKGPRSKTSANTVSLELFIILYYIYILYVIFYSSSACVLFSNSIQLTNPQLSYLMPDGPYNSHEQTIWTTVRLYLAIITCFLCKRHNIFMLPLTKAQIFNFVTNKIHILTFKMASYFQFIIFFILNLPSTVLRNLKNFSFSASCNWNAALNSCEHIMSVGSHLASKLYVFLTNILMWIAVMNLILVVIANPSITNPGPPKATIVNDIKIAYQNVQGLIPLNALNDPNPALNTTKIIEHQSYTYFNKPDIFALNETWLKPSVLDDEILSTNSYNIFRLDRSERSHPNDPNLPKKIRKNGGGVLIATRTDLNAYVKPIKTKCSAEILSVQIELPSGLKIIVCTFYRVGTLGNDNYIKIEAYMQNLCKRRGISNLVILGDLNLGNINWNTLECNNDLDQSFIELFDNLGLTQLVKHPTHNKGNILDLVLTNRPNDITNLTILDENFICKSDHKPIKFDINAKVSRKKNPKREIYNFKRANWEALNEDLSNVNWTCLLQKNEEIEISWQKFKMSLLKNVDKHIPKIKIKTDYQPPWFDSETYELCRKKERLHAAYKKNKSEKSYMQFSQCRRDLKYLIKNKMKDNFTSESEPDEINKKLWSYVKSTNKSNRIPNSVNYSGCHRTCKIEQAELFNKFFYDQFSDESMYNINIDQSTQASRSFDIEFDHFEVCNLLRRINPNKAHGPDGINGMILKNCSATLALPLTILFKKAYTSSCLPSDWKLANVVPIHKKGSKSNVENYRPISLTSLVMKQFEKIVRSKLMQLCGHMISEHQHGFLPGKSCTTQLVAYSDSLAVSLNNNCHTDVIYFDFAKAFDTVNHDRLLHKLKYYYKIDGLLLNFIKSYLQNRKQQVVIGNATSTPCNVNSGVPQGSIVGPLLFVLFINDISENISPGTSIALYADDTKIWREIHSKQDNDILQQDIKSLELWATKNLMKFHPAKCHILPVSHKRLPKLNKRYAYQLNGVVLQYYSTEVDLGVYVTSKLNFTEHCNKLYSKANSRLGLNKRTCFFLRNPQQKRKIYLAMVRSLFEHCSVVWRPHNKTTIDKLESIQKRGIKWILNEEYYSYSKLEYLLRCKQLNILPLEYKLLFNDLLLLHKIIYNLSPIKLPDHLHLFNGERRLRSCHLDTLSLISDIRPKIHAKYSKESVDGTEYKIFENSYFYRSHLAWNKLPLSVREISAPSIFWPKLRGHLWISALEHVLDDFREKKMPLRFTMPPLYKNKPPFADPPDPT